MTKGIVSKSGKLTDKQLMEIQRCALLEVIRLFGSVEYTAQIIDAQRTQVSNWLNGIKRPNGSQQRVSIPYHHAVQLSLLTGVDIERLAPDYHDTNQLLNPTLTNNIIQVKHVDIKCFNISPKLLKRTKHLLSNAANSLDKPLLISTELEMISNMARLMAFQKEKYHCVPVIILDCGSLLRRKINLSKLAFNISLYDKVMLGLWLEKIIEIHMRSESEHDNNHSIVFDKIEHHYFSYVTKNLEKNNPFPPNNKPILYHKLNHDLKIGTIKPIVLADSPSKKKNTLNRPMNELEKIVANCIGYDDDNYLIAKNILFYGCNALIDLVDQNIMPLQKAINLLVEDEETQHEFLATSGLLI